MRVTPLSFSYIFFSYIYVYIYLYSHILCFLASWRRSNHTQKQHLISSSEKSLCLGFCEVGPCPNHGAPSLQGLQIQKTLWQRRAKQPLANSWTQAPCSSVAIWQTELGQRYRPKQVLGGVCVLQTLIPTDSGLDPATLT